MSEPSFKRSFRDLSDEEAADIEKASFLGRFGWHGTFDWDEVLRSKRILIVSEAGAGKTYECKAQAKRLWDLGEPAFFLELATLSSAPVRDLLTQDQIERLDTWQRTETQFATFFLDSIDELKLTYGNFRLALTRLGKELTGHLARARVVVTTRPVTIDRQTFEAALPIPPTPPGKPTPTEFADRIIEQNRQPEEPTEQAPKAWRNVGLMPLSSAEILQLAKTFGVSDPSALLADIHRRDALEFAGRPQDLIDLCSDWNEHLRIRSHREQVETNISFKLKPRATGEVVPLTSEQAEEGASRLALAALLTRKLTLRRDASSDTVIASEAALDVSKVLQDWTAEARNVLLERALFGFVSYGRVRFHHRSVLEFLAAKRLHALLARGVSHKAIRRLLFVETAFDGRAVRPSMAAVAAWLAISQEAIFDEVLALNPAVLLDHGDPQSLSPQQRIRALEAYVQRYGDGGWRGLRTPRVQVQRFATEELSPAINRLWSAGVENSEVRDLLLQTISVGRIKGSADIAFQVAMNASLPKHERAVATEALLRLQDGRVEDLASSLTSEPERWPSDTALAVIVDLFPRFLPIPRLEQLLRRVRERTRGIGALNYHLPEKIGSIALQHVVLDDLRNMLTRLVAESLSWSAKRFPKYRTDRADLLPALVAVCARLAREAPPSEEWAYSATVAVRLSKDSHRTRDDLVELRSIVAKLPPEVREAVFWREDELLQALNSSQGGWDRTFDRWAHGALKPSEEKDSAWVRKATGDPKERADRRELALLTDTHYFTAADLRSEKQRLEALRPLVADNPQLVSVLDGRLKGLEDARSHRRVAEADRRYDRRADERKAKDHASWVAFCNEISNDPEGVFTEQRQEATAWNLWRAMARNDLDPHVSGWDREFLETQFDASLANRLRLAMMSGWRKLVPTLRSERPPADKNSYASVWDFGLAGVFAEAEDREWATKLTPDDARLACRYAHFAHGGFPPWLNDLIREHPQIVDDVLGQELSRTFKSGDPGDIAWDLQTIRYAQKPAKGLLLHRIRDWLTESDSSGDMPAGNSLEHAIEILISDGGEDDRRLIEQIACARLRPGSSETDLYRWLPVLLTLDPATSVDVIEARLGAIEASANGLAVQLFSRLSARDGAGVTANLKAKAFTPALLLRLVRVAFQHVRLEHDEHHEDAFTPGARDYAERARDGLLSALLSTTGADAWAAKLELAADPSLGHLRDRIIALAKTSAAEEAEGAAMTEGEFVLLDRTGESPPKTLEAMFSVMRDRVEDLDDMLMRDASPREMWAAISTERVMRRALARELQQAANGAYQVEQESVTADEKETDIRLKSAIPGQQGVIELKLGDDRSAADLIGTIERQLVAKYMASDECRAGCLIVTVAKESRWKHPTSGAWLGVEELRTALEQEAARITKELSGAARVMAKVLDLRPRLRTEASARGSGPRATV
ncbi:hypothetical protein J2X48_002483 [Bosea sp. BE271]|uniref:hypothetical protein n=1 Tax=Bosea TaxID=85413 RepID=UPI0028642239|nr:MULTISPECIES: hypothetical protein [Bosea]MDR6830797.1 hypothetical protein [Bosea robiniae]MDR6895454.1 hypothetical protein [Bosea sp. BE109]MDR7138850.1 hypothetical protein [Bosea sp. BE168]MDR7175551.1 hypothetical protein [Bosea sp. BE271]